MHGLGEIELLGTWLCLVTKPTEERESREYICGENGTVGDPPETKYWFEVKEGTVLGCHL
jgi:hypothetical protein